MDQAIKSALSKYNGKKDTSVARHTSGNGLIVLGVLVLLVALFSICVKTGAFHADELWNKISSVSLNIGTFTETLQRIFVRDNEAPVTDPVNETGESGTVSAADTICKSISAEYLKNISSKLQFVQPLKGEITCGYGQRIHPLSGKPGFHTGIDIAAELGTPVVSFQDGIIEKEGSNQTYGKYILIKHGSCESFYGHLSEVKVKCDQKVKMGQTVGLVGTTGESTGPHLHFEIRINGQTSDPAKSVYA